MCLLGQTLKPCTHPDCADFYSRIPQTTALPSLHTIVESLISTMLMRYPVLSGLCYTTKALIEKTEELEKAKANHQVPKTHFENPFLGQNNYNYKISLASAAPLQVYKEKGFSISIQVYDNNDDPAFLQDLFKVQLYSNDSPPKLLKLNIASKKILRGTLEGVMDEQGIVNFGNIVINEVSSHYIKESFVLIISCEMADVKPLIIENLYVRARNFHKKEKVIN